MAMPKKKTDTTKLWEDYFDTFKRRNWQKALQILNSIIEVSPNDPNVYLKIGDIEQRIGHPNEAIAAYHKAAWYLIKSGFRQKALAIYKLILRIDPVNEEAIKQSNALLMEMESERQAVSAFEFTPTAPEPEAEKTQVYEGSYGMIDIGGEKEQEEEPQVSFPSLTEGESIEEPVIPAVFSCLTKEEALGILSQGEKKNFEAGSVIVEEGDTGDSMFIIKNGTVKVVAHILGRKIELATLGPADVFGEVAFLTGRPRTASVIAETPTEVIEINRLALEDAIEKNPRVLEKLQDFFHSRVQDTIKKVKGG